MTTPNIDTKALRELVRIASAIEDPPSAAQLRAIKALADAAPAPLDLADRAQAVKRGDALGILDTVEAQAKELLAERDALKAEVETLLQAIEKMAADGLSRIGEVGAASTRANRAEGEIDTLRAKLSASEREAERLRGALRDIASVSVVEVHYGREMLGIRTNDGMALVSIEEDTADALRGEDAKP